MSPKIYLNQHEVYAFRQHAKHTGKTDEVERWLKDCVIVVEPMKRSLWMRLRRRW